MKIDFNFSKKETLGDAQMQVSNGIIEFLKKGQDFSVSFSSDKSGKQLRGYWRLIGLIQPYIEESYGIKGKDEVSSFLKRQNGFLKEVKTRKETIFIEKSLAKATKEDLIGLIEKIYFICEFYEIKDYELKPQEQRDMENYFN
jgi:hypothetical protein